MRNKRVRVLRKEALDIMPVSILNNGIYHNPKRHNPFKNFIRRYRKANR